MRWFVACLQEKSKILAAKVPENGAEYPSEKPPTPLLDTVNYPVHMKNLTKRVRLSPYGWLLLFGIVDQFHSVESIFIMAVSQIGSIRVVEFVFCESTFKLRFCSWLAFQHTWQFSSEI